MATHVRGEPLMQGTEVHNYQPKESSGRSAAGGGQDLGCYGAGYLSEFWKWIG